VSGALTRLTAVQLRAAVQDLLATAGIPEPSDLDAAMLLGALDGALRRAGYCMVPLELTLEMRTAMHDGWEPLRSFDAAYRRALAAA
jgi:hypothetical protein